MPQFSLLTSNNRILKAGESQLQGIPRIGPWTAGAAVADYSNDFTCYPYADLAVRTWAKRAAPSYPWPDSEQELGRLWQRLAGDQFATLTLLTLAWGVSMEIPAVRAIAGADLAQPFDALFINAPATIWGSVCSSWRPGPKR